MLYPFVVCPPSSHHRYGIGLYCDVSCAKRVGAMRRWHGVGAADVRHTPTKGRSPKTPPSPKPPASKASSRTTSLPRRLVTRSRVARQLQWTISLVSDDAASELVRPKTQPAKLRRRNRVQSPLQTSLTKPMSTTPATMTFREADLKQQDEEVQELARDASRVTPAAVRTRTPPPNPVPTPRGTAAASHTRHSAQAKGPQSSARPKAGHPYQPQYLSVGDGSHSTPEKPLRHPKQAASEAHASRPWQRQQAASQGGFAAFGSRQDSQGMASKPGPESVSPKEKTSLPSASAVTVPAQPQPPGTGGCNDTTEGGGLVGECLELYYYSCGWTVVDIIAYRPDSDEHRVRRHTDRREHWADLRYCRVRFSAEEGEIE